MPIDSVLPQPSHLLLSPFPLSLNPSQHQGLSQHLATSGGQSIGTSASASVLTINIQCWFPLGLTGLISLLSKGPSRVFSNTTFESINSLALSLLYGPTLTSIHEDWKKHSFDCMDVCWEVISLLYNTLSRFITVFFLRSKHLLISWLRYHPQWFQSPRK